MPGHGLRWEELQFVVVQTETGEREETSKGLGVEIVQGVMAKTEPFDVLQALQEQEASRSTPLFYNRRFKKNGQVVSKQFFGALA